MRKKLLNYNEQLTDRVLQEACERHSARVFAKSRIADVIPVDNSGISNDLFGYALKAHFDFVVAGPELTALFVVEFDGPTHQDVKQQSRDHKKDEICERFNLPLLRINAEYLNRNYRNLDLLTWIVEVWFANEAFNQAQASGHIPADEPFDPGMFFSIPGLKGRFPLWLSAEPRGKIRQLHESGKVRDQYPSLVIGKDKNGVYRGFAYIRIDQQSGVFTCSAMRSQRFPILESEVLYEILPFQVHQQLLDVLNGEDNSKSYAEIDSALAVFTKDVRIQSTSCSGG